MEDLRTELEALKKVVAEQDKRILKLEQIEQMLDERERKNKSNLEKQKISLVKREELTKKIRLSNYLRCKKWIPVRIHFSLTKQ